MGWNRATGHRNDERGANTQATLGTTATNRSPCQHGPGGRGAQATWSWASLQTTHDGAHTEP